MSASNPAVNYLKRAEKQGRKFLNPVPTAVGGLRIVFKVLPQYFSNKAQVEPKQPLGPFHTDASLYATESASGLRVTWFGHSASLIEIDGIRVLVDPVWEQRASPVSFMGPKRFFAPTIPLESLPKIDVVLISHDHYDHLGADTVRQLAKTPAAAAAQWVTSLGVGERLRAFGVPAEKISELDWTGSVNVGTLKVTSWPSRHFSGRGLSDRFTTLWGSFVLEGPKHRVYYGADSGEWDGFVDIGKQFGPFDLTMLEIGASDPLLADIHMGPEGVVRSFRALGGHGLLMPIHWGLFDLALHPWTKPIESVFAVKDLKLWSPTPGLPSEVIHGEEIRSDWWR